MVSIVIPVHNDKGTLENTVKSVINQSYTKWEMIIVDDGSDNPVEQLLSEIKDNRIRVLRQEKSNANIARNFGIVNSKGEYIAMLDGDDCWLKDHLKDCMVLIKKRKADGLYGSLFLKYDNTNAYDKREVFYARKLKIKESMVDYLLSTGYGAQTSTLFTTAESMKDILWSSELIEHQDYDFVVRFNKKYKLIPKIKPTVVYSLSSKRSFHFETCIKFLEANKLDINPSIFCWYNRKMLSLAIQKNTHTNNITYFQEETVRYKEYLSYQQYISIMDPKTFFQELYYKLSYLFYILKISTEL